VLFLTVLIVDRVVRIRRLRDQSVAIGAQTLLIGTRPPDERREESWRLHRP